MAATKTLSRKAFERRGLIAWFARNTVAANLLFFLLIAIGVLGAVQMRLEVFPEITPRIVTVSVAYPGANPEEVEQGIVLRLEEAVADVEGIKRIRGVAVENRGVVTVEAHDHVDIDTFYDDVKAAVERLTTLPEQAERLTVTRAGERIGVVTLAVFGDVDRRTLKETAELIKDDLQQTGAVSQITLSGVPEYEISVELDERTLRQYGLTFADVGQAIRTSSLDLPAGEIRGAGTQMLVRSTSQGYRARDFEQVIVRRGPDGSAVRVADLGRVNDGFAEDDYFIEFDGHPAVLLQVYRIGNEGALNIASTIDDYLANQQALLPPGVQLATYNAISDALKSRIELMLRNGAIGLTLVVIILGVFLDARLAFWAAGGLVMSVVASFIVLASFDVSINMISLFAYILVLGILVDDAIVVGENIHAHREMGKDAITAAIDGTREVALPVSVTIMTSIVAFAPLLFASGVMGEILAVIPIVVISVLVLSLVEVLLILPAHLSGAGTWEPRFYRAIHSRASGALDRLGRGPYRRLLGVAVRWRYVTVSCAVGVLMVSIGWVAGGLLPWVYFPTVEGDVVSVQVEFPPGTSAAVTERAMRRIHQATAQLEQEFGALRPPDAPPLLRHVQLAVGGLPYGEVSRGPGSGPAVAARDARLGEVIIELLRAEQRDISASAVAHRWRELVGPVPGARSVEFRSELLTAGDAVNIELRSRSTPELLASADWLKGQIAGIEGTRDIRDDLQSGRPEVRITGLTPLGTALGLTEADVFRQVRGAFHGEEAQRLQRGRDEVRVMVRYPPEQRRSVADVENLHIRLPDGTEAPLSQVAVYELGEGFGAINRTNRRRVASVTADVDASIATAEDVNTVLVERILPELEARFGQVSWSMEGEQREQAESLASLRLALLVALVGIYGILAMQFRSYIQPLVVMSAIPFGLVGAIAGHVIMHELVRPTPLSFLSMFGIVALTGVVVNDSLILIDLINRQRLRRRAGDDPRRLLAVTLAGGVRRFRPIFLTTVTTFFGLVPIIMETSLQAQFIIPMAVSLGFGVVFATAITLLLVPSLYLIVEDGRRLLTPVLGDTVRYETPVAQAEAATHPVAGVQ